MIDKPTLDFYDLIHGSRTREAYNLLIADPSILRKMSISEIPELYSIFGKVIPTGELKGLANLIIREATGTDKHVVI